MEVLDCCGAAFLGSDLVGIRALPGSIDPLGLDRACVIAVDAGCDVFEVEVDSALAVAGTPIALSVAAFFGARESMSSSPGLLAEL